MKAIKKTDENLVKVAQFICSHFPHKGFYSPNDFKVLNHYITLYSHADIFTYYMLKHIPCNFRYSVSCEYNNLVLDIWY